ncbi:hypothetical protein F383_31441 [Gossypium arboreum]|uniref:Uncharacterized protein n=1 Tax=Gossypium arboreum TaxID=29729 RepID=A0A0B0N1R5_GOSAR|nr:hypothetical protein F383_31441 [Gossypium arboreum]
MSQHTKSTRPGPPHTGIPHAVSIWQNRSMTHTGGPHACGYLTGLTTGVSHGHVPIEPK